MCDYCLGFKGGGYPIRNFDGQISCFVDFDCPKCTTSGKKSFEEMQERERMELISWAEKASNLDMLKRMESFYSFQHEYGLRILNDFFAKKDDISDRIIIYQPLFGD